jgi:hypothetical protein
VKRYLLIVFSLVVVLAACRPVTFFPEPTGTAEGPAYLHAPTETEEVRNKTQIYADPAGQYRVTIPADWQPVGTQGGYEGSDGFFRTGYLPEMAFMDHAYRVCERLADMP